MTVVAITGARGFRKGEEDSARALIRKTLGSMQGVTEFRTGAAFGADTAACELGLLAYRRAHHKLYVPAAPHNAALVEGFRAQQDVRKTEVIAVKAGKDNAASYKLRNLEMLRGAEIVVAFPSTGEEQLRSGTWMTVRIARVQDIPLLIVPLDGVVPWVENGMVGQHRVRA